MTKEYENLRVVISKEKMKEYMQVPPEIKLRFLEELILLKYQIKRKKK